MKREYKECVAARNLTFLSMEILVLASSEVTQLTISILIFFVFSIRFVRVALKINTSSPILDKRKQNVNKIYFI